MKKSDPFDKILPDFILAQKAMKKILKDSENPHFKNEYASLEAVLDEAKATYQANNMVMTQDADAMATGEGIILTTTLLHSSGQWIESTCPIFMSKKDAQTTGSAITYARRYGLKNLAGLTEKGDDDDGAEASEIDMSKRRDAETLSPITDSQIDEACHLFTLLEAPENKIMATCVKFSTDGGKFRKLGTSKQHIEALMKSEATAMIRHLNTTLKKGGV